MGWGAVPGVEGLIQGLEALSPGMEGLIQRLKALSLGVGGSDPGAGMSVPGDGGSVLGEGGQQGHHAPPRQAGGDTAAQVPMRGLTPWLH